MTEKDKKLHVSSEVFKLTLGDFKTTYDEAEKVYKSAKRLLLPLSKKCVDTLNFVVKISVGVNLAIKKLSNDTELWEDDIEFCRVDKDNNVVILAGTPFKTWPRSDPENQPLEVHVSYLSDGQPYIRNNISKFKQNIKEDKFTLSNKDFKVSLSKVAGNHFFYDLGKTISVCLTQETSSDFVISAIVEVHFTDSERVIKEILSGAYILNNTLIVPGNSSLSGDYVGEISHARLTVKYHSKGKDYDANTIPREVEESPLKQATERSEKKIRKAVEDLKTIIGDYKVNINHENAEPPQFDKIYAQSKVDQVKNKMLLQGAETAFIDGSLTESEFYDKLVKNLESDRRFLILDLVKKDVYKRFKADLEPKSGFTTLRDKLFGELETLMIMKEESSCTEHKETKSNIDIDEVSEGLSTALEIINELKHVYKNNSDTVYGLDMAALSEMSNKIWSALSEIKLSKLILRMKNAKNRSTKAILSDEPFRAGFRRKNIVEKMKDTKDKSIKAILSDDPSKASFIRKDVAN
jgi:hypothetical protein